MLEKRIFDVLPRRLSTIYWHEFRERPRAGHGFYRSLMNPGSEGAFGFMDVLMFARGGNSFLSVVRADDVILVRGFRRQRDTPSVFFGIRLCKRGIAKILEN